MPAKLRGRRLVANEKVTAYLLSLSHPEGGSKAKFFQQFGFELPAADRLVEALLDHPQANPVIMEITSPHGIKRIVECNIASPDGRNPCIRTIWLIEPETDVHRVITAVPRDQKSDRYPADGYA